MEILSAINGPKDPKIRIYKLSRSSRYALQGLGYLAALPKGETCLLATIAKANGLPVSFLAKIFQKLSKRGLLKAKPGVNGGYELARPASEIFLAEIVLSVDEPAGTNQCLLQLRNCNAADPCEIHEAVERADKILMGAFEKTTLSETTKSKTAV